MLFSSSLCILVFWVHYSCIFNNILKLYFSSRKLYIADARPRKNALANGAMGGGSESSSNYFQSEVCNRFLNCSLIFFIFKFWFYFQSSKFLIHILSDSLFWDRQHSCNERELCSSPRIHRHSWQNIIGWNVIFFGQYLNVKKLCYLCSQCIEWIIKMAWYAVVSKLCSNNYSVGSYTFITTFSWFRKSCELLCKHKSETIISSQIIL